MKKINWKKIIIPIVIILLRKIAEILEENENENSKEK